MGTSTIGLAAVFLVAGATALDDAYPHYAVAKDAVLEREYKSTTKLESKPAKMYLGGEEVPTEGHPVLKLRVEDTKRITFADTIGAVADGRPTKFTREYGVFENAATETVVAQPPGGEEESRASTRERSSRLAGKSVAFTWDGSEYQRKFATGEEKEGDRELLAGLLADAEWLPLLEGGPRAKGATFEVDPKLFGRVQYPAGDPDWRIDGQAPEDVSKEINQQLADNLDGTAKATWQGVREEDGRQVGVFEITAQLTSKAEAVAEMKDRTETRGVELELAYEGEILWDMAAGRIAGYALEADVRSVLSTMRQQDTPKGKMEVKQVFDLEGKAKHVLTVEAK